MFYTSILPLVASLLLIVDIVLSAMPSKLKLKLKLKSGSYRLLLLGIIVAASVLPVFSFIPAMQLPLVLYARAIVGDLSVSTLIILTLHILNHIGGPRIENFYQRALYKEIVTVCLAIVPVSLILFATALGWTYFDPYSHGYYPTALSAILLTLFIVCLWEKLYLSSLIICASFLAYAFKLMDSDNLWNYLTDPVLLIYGLVIIIRDRKELVRKKLLCFTFPSEVVQRSLVSLAAIFLLFAIFLKQLNEYELGLFVAQYSFISWCTCLSLLTLSIVFFSRAWRLKSTGSTTSLLITFCIAIVSLLAAVRGFSSQEPLPRVIFLSILSTGVVIYLFLLTMLYRSKPSFHNAIDSLAIPVAKNYQIACYLGAIVLIETLFDMPVQRQLLEFTLSIMIMLNLTFPSNKHIYNLPT